MKKVYVMLADGFEEIEAVTPIDLLRRAGIVCQSVSVTGNLTVNGARGIPVIADALFTDELLYDADACILPGGMQGAITLQNHAGLNNALIYLNNHQKIIGAICAAPMILGKLGLVEGKKATIYPGMEDKLTGARYSDSAVCADCNIITSRGAGTAIPFSLALIHALLDEQAKQNIQNAIVFPA